VVSLHQLHLLAKTGQGTQEGVGCPSGSKVIDSSQGAQDTLHTTLTLSVVFDDLKVSVRVSTLYADKHVVSPD
jgi:hypothetical protein